MKVETSGVTKSSIPTEEIRISKSTLKSDRRNSDCNVTKIELKRLELKI